MKVILNTESVRYPLTGIGRYTYELALALQQHASIESLSFYANGRFKDELASPISSQTSAMRPQSARIKAVLQKSSLFMGLYGQLSEVLRTNNLKGLKNFVYHGPNFFLPRFEGPCVATFHDLSPFKWAHCHEPAKVQFLQRKLKKTIERADRLITDSEFTRQELAAYFSYPIERIDTVPLACSADFKPRTSRNLQSFLDRYQLSFQGYCLFVGTIEPRKNILTLLNAYELMPKALRLRWPLVLTGYKGWISAEIHDRIRVAERQGWARYLGYLAAEELPLLYSGARLFSFPSHYEGFGLPVLEAMSSGVPVVCSDSSSLPEVAGGAALLHNPNDVEELSKHLSRGLEDNAWREQASAKGLTHAHSFSWQRCAIETVAVYQQVTTSSQ